MLGSKSQMTGKMAFFENLTQRRKGAKVRRISSLRLCAFA
jgi:hypothetical protein